MRAERRDITRVPLQSTEGNFLHKISHAEGAGMVACGTAIALKDFRYGQNAIVGYRVTQQAKASSSKETAPVITRGEIVTTAGLNGRSFTKHLPEWDTKLRDSKQARIEANDPAMPPEDFIELTEIKMAWWTRIPLHNPKHVAWA